MSSISNSRRSLYHVTLPPPSYPSASPYYSLTKYFARLVKKKVITRQMLRKLLHERTWAKALELSGLPVRRRHKNHIRLRIENDGTIGTETEYSDSDDSERETDTTESYTTSSCTDTDAAYCSKILRQNAMDSTSPRAVSSSRSSWGSNHGYVRCFDHTAAEHFDINQPISGDCTKNLFQSITLSNNDVSDVNDLTEKHSLLPKQHSESTENSSFEVRPYMACEDLVNIDDNTAINTLGNEEVEFIPTRRSCPNYKAKVDALPKLWKSTEESYSREELDSDDDGDTDLLQHLAPPSPKQSGDYSPVGSVIIDPPPMFRNKEDDLKIINVNLNTDIPFRKHSLNSDKRIRRSLSKSMVESECFINKNDEARVQRMSSQSENNKVNKKCECCNRSLCPSPRSSDSGVVGSCNLASPELNMHEYSNSNNTGNDSDTQEKKTDYIKRSLSNIHQGSYDNDRRKKLTLSEIEAAAFEDQCRCTSPFGSTARTSCVTSVTSENSLDVMDSSNTNLTSTFTASPPVLSAQIKRTSIRRNIESYVPVIKLKPDPPPRIYRKPSTHLEIPKNVRQPMPCQWGTLNITERTKPSLHYHMRIYKDNLEGNDANRQSRVNTPRNRDVFNKDGNSKRSSTFAETRKTRSRSEDLSKMQKGLSEASSGFVVYRSDLYAHWWMKAKLPITVVTDSGKDHYFVKRYCLCITGLTIVNALKFDNR